MWLKEGRREAQGGGTVWSHSQPLAGLSGNQTCREDACLLWGLGPRLRTEKTHLNLAISLQN